MSFTATDILYSIPITAVIILAIMWLYKRANNWPTPMGCLLGCVIVFWLVLCAVGGCSSRKRAKSEAHLVEVTLVSTGEVVKIPRTDFVGIDTIFRKSKHVYKNDTGRELVEYMVKYSANGYDNDHQILGHVIQPGDYFYWYNNDKNYRMFSTPPTSTTVITRSRYGRSHEVDFTYLTFLDYVENVPDYVTIVRSKTNE